MREPAPKTTDRYRVVRPIGSGGMGAVYEALDVERGERVALKTMLNVDAESLYRFKREFRELADVSHPNLLTLYELVVGEGSSFFTMELVDGDDFIAHIRGGGVGATTDASTLPALAVFDEDRLRPALRQLALGISALHRAGKVHRDVKPSNVLVTKSGRVVILDFGLVFDPEESTYDAPSAHIVGTVEYMSPEQALAERTITPASDWYSVGVMLYEALTGRMPHTGSTSELLLSRLRELPLAPRRIAPDVPGDLDALCMDLLAVDPGDRPSGAAVLERLGAEPVDPSRSTISSSTGSVRLVPFAGRRSELAALGQALSHVDSGLAAMAIVRGPSGIGKSTLLKEFLRALREREDDVVTLEGRCYASEFVPFKAMDGVIDQLARYWKRLDEREELELLPRQAALLPRLFPVLGSVRAVATAPKVRDVPDPQEMRTLAFGALRECFQRLGDRRTLIVVLDDLQWTDADTKTLLQDLMRPPDPPRMLLILLARNEGAEELELLARRIEAPRVEVSLGPLDEQDAAALALRMLGEQGGALAQRLAREADGNPFFLTELIRHVKTAGEAGLGRVNLAEMLNARVDNLPEAEKRILELVVVSGETLARTALAGAARLPADQIARAVRALLASNLIRTASGYADERLEPYHDRIREAVLQDMDAERRRRRHEELAVSLEATAPADTLARHWHGAGHHERAAEYAETAARIARSTLDFDRAAALYRMALELGNPAPDKRRELEAALGEALSNAGRPTEAADALFAASVGADAATRLELRQRGAVQLLRGGYVARGLETLRSVLSELGLRLASTPLLALVSILVRGIWLRLRGTRFREREESEVPRRDLLRLEVLQSAAIALVMVDNIRATDFQVRHVLLALRVGEPKQVARALAVAAVVTVSSGGARQAHRFIAQAKEIEKRVNAPWVRAAVVGAEAFVHWFAESAFRAALDKYEQSEKLFREHIQTAGWETDTTQLHACLCLLFLGEVAEARRRVVRYVREADRRGDRYASVGFRTRLNAVWLQRDDINAAEREIEEAIGTWTPPTSSYHYQHFYALIGRCELALYRGDAHRAYEHFQADLPRLRHSLLSRVAVSNIVASQLRARAAIAEARRRTDEGRPSEARPLIAEARREMRHLRKLAFPLAQALVPLLEAGVAELGGDKAGSVDALRRAIAIEDRVEMRLYAAAARFRLARELGGSEGDDLRAEAASWMQRQRIESPERWTLMLAPGWRD